MTKKSVTLWLITLFLGAIAVAVASDLIRGFVKIGPVALGWYLGSALTAFVIPGVIPLIWWGVNRGRVEKAKGPLQLWSFLFVLFALNLLYGARLESQ